jgi:hypothetical protein
MISQYQPHRLASSGVLIMLIFAYLVLPHAAAQTDRGDSFIDTDSRQSLKNDSKAAATKWSGSVGVAFIDAEDGSKIKLTPFTLDVKLKTDTTLKIEGDGYGRIDFAGNTTQGFNNITLIASQVVYRDAVSRVRLSLGATTPGSSGIGSQSAKQRVSANYTRNINTNWSVQASGKLTRRNQEPRAGESRMEQSARLQTTYTFDADSPTSRPPSALIIQIERDYRRGVGGSSKATASYEFPLSATLSGSIGFTRGLTPGLRDNTVAFDLLFGF